MSRKLIGAISILIVLFIANACQVKSQEELSHQVTNKKNRSEILQEKIFPFFSVVKENPGILNWLSANELLIELRANKINTINKELALEKSRSFLDVHSVGNLFKWSDAEIKQVTDQFLKMPESELKALVNNLKASNKFYLDNNRSENKFLGYAVERELRGVNRIIDVYTLGVKSRYAGIDSVSYNVKSDYYQKVVHLSALNIMDDIKEMKQVYDPSLTFALFMLKINERDEAARFEPMEQKENAAAVKKAKTTNWDAYPYSVLLIPGHGPEEEGVALSPLGMLRCKLAADRYHKKTAPFLIVSGGYVHPFKTKFCEAIEMKKTLMNQYNIPESAIIIEPHARHTTTNFRNAARLIYKYGIPAEKWALCATTVDQSYYITDMRFDKRCMEELGYMPHKIGNRLSRNDVEFIPQKESLTVDYVDPLDP